ncbi:hypothetical protein BDP55DRAFT_395619 [Colletotrichum godetiae]|uniref:Uncharacterized protein n=1 Tax=Colletotrichum godetiae TaxID=1209918 RepID=A0AAJ0ABH1_9PEZI|nr:uncharacterized protein BDP55DRAFT_395619 [Colletotrichum godetiae]KAK1658541.1 hypothetical protein BDP55DRAFT_395619 [Colletotrichum godetiae]
MARWVLPLAESSRVGRVSRLPMSLPQLRLFALFQPPLHHETDLAMEQNLEDERRRLDERVAQLQAELEKAQQEATSLTKAQETIDLLTRRVNKVDRLPRQFAQTCSHIDIRQTEIEALVKHKSSLSAAVGLLDTQEIHVNWYRCFEEWKNSPDPKYLGDYFKETANAIISLNGLKELDEGPSETVLVQNHSDNYSQKRRRGYAEETSVSDRETLTPDTDNPGISIACTDINLQHQQATPTYIDYTFAYMFKTEKMFSMFSESFMDRIQRLATWGTERTTSCIRAHISGKQMEFVFDWELPTAPPVEEIFSGPSQATVNIKHATQLCLRVPYEEGQYMLNCMTPEFTLPTQI